LNSGENYTSLFLTELNSRSLALHLTHYSLITEISLNGEKFGKRDF